MIFSTNRRGVVLMVTAMACYALNDALVKLTLHAFPAGQVLLMRGLLASTLLMAISWRHAGGPSAAGDTSALWHPLLALRCLLEVTTAITSVLALSQASLALVSAIMMTAPLLIAAASMTLGWERPHPRLLGGVALGLAGALLVLRPTPQSSSAGLTLAGLCAVSLAARDMVTRRLPSSMPSSLVAALTTCSVCAVAPVFSWAMGESWVSPARPEAIAVSAAAGCAAVGNYALVAACRDADLSVVTPFRYSLIVWASLVGFMVWGDVPDALNLAGIAIIATAGVVTLRAAARR
ncbi:DMT family transporter [Variovorax sp. RCC_210]|uniref:DMT family transporter n=1 Tax=Variovorax sp. RCC_210 TaxID=3239217 RepID=UPI00352568C7